MDPSPETLHGHRDNAVLSDDNSQDSQLKITIGGATTLPEVKMLIREWISSNISTSIKLCDFRFSYTL